MTTGQAELIIKLLCEINGGITFLMFVGTIAIFYIIFHWGRKRNE